MKKLMFVAAVAAATVALANTCVTTTVKTKDECTGEVTKEKVTGVGTAHKVAITLKTTTAKYKKAKNDCSACTYYVDQATVKISGLIWKQLLAPGCDECEKFCQGLGDQNSIFWTKDSLLDVDFAVKHGVIGKGSSKKIEAYGAFGDLKWAGFGTLAGKETKGNACSAGDCSAYVKSISGGIAGWLETDWQVKDACGDCDLEAADNCCDAFDPLDTTTAAYGTIKISYDTATAKKVAVASDEMDVASFVKLPAAALIDEDGEKIDPADFIKEVTIEE